MRVLILLACVAVAISQGNGQNNGNGDGDGDGGDGGMFMGPERIDPSANGDAFNDVDKCSRIGAPFCSKCENPGLRCYWCLPGSVLYTDYSGCKECDQSNCVDCIWDEKDVTTTCLECGWRHYLTSEGLCEECGTNCNYCSLDEAGITVCDDCFAATIRSNLAPESCLGCGTKCLACSAAVDDAITCSSCASGYVLADGKCESCPSNCVSCSKVGNTKECSACVGDFQVSIDKTRCLPCATGCTGCGGESAFESTRAACTGCRDDYYLPTSGGDQCLRCLDNCADCDTAGVCNTCDLGFYLSVGGSSCEPCPFKCKTCDDDQSCTECVADYTPKAATSVTCDACPANCLVCTVSQAAASKCTTCASEYYRDGQNTCKKCSSNCLTCNDNTRCTDCKTGYNLADDNACYECPANCANDQMACIYNTTMNTVHCTVCDVGWTPNTDSTQCTQCDEGCDGYCNWNGTLNAAECICSTGAVSTATGAQMFRGDCDVGAANDYACKSGYYYDVDGTTNNGAPACDPCSITGCIHCNSTAAVTCNDCNAAGYIVAPNTALNCDACSLIHSKCLRCSNSDTCTSCGDGYGLVTDGTKRTCKVCGTLCRTCTFSGTGSSATSNCGDCKANAVKDPDVSANCKACIAPCTSCSVASDGSTICDSNGCPGTHVWKADTCESCPANCGGCELLNDVVVCTDGACATKYGKIGDGTCQPCPDNCDRCSFSTAEGADNTLLLCDTCASRFARNDQVCAPCPSNCPTCTESIGNIKGDTSRAYYYLDSSTGFCPRCPTNCPKCSASSCSLCDDGYGLTANRKQCSGCSALTKVENCRFCTDEPVGGNATCLECNSGYTLNDNSDGCTDNSIVVGNNFCVLRADHYPECNECDGSTGRYLVPGLREHYVAFPKLCAYNCYKCGSFDRETNTILIGDDEVCNVKKDANYTQTEYCYDGFCAMFSQLANGKRSLSARGCYRNSTCVDTPKEKDRSLCVGEKKNDFCMRCTYGDLANLDQYSGSTTVYASITLLVLALWNALSLTH